ncbi:MAG: single-stranded-DNA-specific exonuclease RecJ [Lachnospiraceae bacterium]|nr:single-stranded-DNA-specific exonuclease RecJ [Lachnospiraceae bacterium]
MKKWVVAAKRADFNAIAEKYGISPMLARIMRNRDIISDEEISMYLNGRVSDMHDPRLMKDLEKAAGMIEDVIKSGEKIYIIGDYDIDGVCASCILMKGICALSGQAMVRLPDRVVDGYGMNMGMVDEALNWGASCVITCDNGISAYDEVKYAREKGLKVIVTDHHEIPFRGEGDDKEYIVPPADAVIDPKQEDCSYPYKEICGAMVAFKLIKFLLEGKGKEDLLDELLMFAGFATVGDIMDLKDENRIAVKFSLEEMKRTGNPGMQCLIDVTGVDRNRLSPYHIGFILGPCINATGRLDSADRALSMFLTDDHAKALTIAGELKSLNDSRKDKTEYYKNKAIEMIEESGALGIDKIMVLYLPDCHESLAGIIAGRLKEKYSRPVFVLTDSEDGVKGSGRSVDAYDMYSGMCKCSDLFIKFGGHRMAAGLSMKRENIEELRKRLNENCDLSEDDMADKLTADIALPLKYATHELARELDRLEPYGKGNARPLFAQKDLLFSDLKVLGKNRNVVKLKLRPEDGSCPGIDAVIFGEGDEIESDISKKQELAVMYELDINEYMGRSEVQLVIKDYR